MARKRRSRAPQKAAESAAPPPQAQSQPPPPPRPAQPANGPAKRKPSPKAPEAVPIAKKPKPAPARPRPTPTPETKPAAPKPKSAQPDEIGNESPTVRSEIRSALEALEAGCVSEAYLALLRALSTSDEKLPNEDALYKIDQAAMLVSRAKKTVREDGNRQDVLKDLDEARAISTELAAGTHPPKKFDSPVTIHRLRLFAHMSLNEYEKVLAEAAAVKSKSAGLLPAVIAMQMTASFQLGRLAEAAEAAEYLLRFPGAPLNETRMTTQWTLCASLYFNLGMAHLRLHHFRRAIDNFTEAIDFGCSHAKVFRNRAVAYERLGFFNDAESDLHDAMEAVDAEKDPKTYEYLKKEYARVEELADEQEQKTREQARKRHEALFDMMRGPPKDKHLRTLGLEVGASEIQIKAAFKLLARQHHPDKGGDPEKFKEVRSAYEALLGTGTSDAEMPECVVA
ncbi:hypothetical protein JCM3774_005289 [Rhodotorula dairenensis]